MSHHLSILWVVPVLCFPLLITEFGDEILQPIIPKANRDLIRRGVEGGNDT